MNRGAMILASGAAMLVIAGCGGGAGDLEIRSVSSGIKPGILPVPARIAEARGHFALGNIALALEGYRRALREDPASIDARNGLAACYDRMGRFDQSRRYYEEALALAPDDARLYANLAVSLEMQGRKQDAAEIRAEYRQRKEASQAAGAALAEVRPDLESESVATAPSAAAPTVAAQTVTVTLAPPVPGPVRASTSTPADGPKLHRVSMGEVTLVTTGKPIWKPRLVERLVSGRSQLTLLNAARVRGLAARTRLALEGRGWHRIAIGDAARIEQKSVIAYPASRRAEAVRLSRQLGFSLRRQPSADGRLLVLLGRDAAVRSGVRS